MKTSIKNLIITAALLALTACSTTSNSRAHLAADPLSATPNQTIAVSGDKKTYIGSVAFDSASKCDNFISTIVADQASLNTGTSIASIIFSTLATVVNPVNTAHALSAGATVVTASRDSVNLNLYNKGTFIVFQSALQSTYYANLNRYLDALSSADEANLNVGIEVAKLQTIHASCSLAAAEASILATMAPPNANGSSPDSGNPPPGAGSAPVPGSAPRTTSTRGVVPGGRIW